MENDQKYPTAIDELLDLTTGLVGMVEVLMTWALVSNEKRALPYFRERLQLRLAVSARERSALLEGSTRLALDEMTVGLFESFLEKLTGVQYLLDAEFPIQEAVHDEFRFQGYARRHVRELDAEERRSTFRLVPSGSDASATPPDGERPS